MTHASGIDGPWEGARHMSREQMGHGWRVRNNREQFRRERCRMADSGKNGDSASKGGAVGADIRKAAKALFSFMSLRRSASSSAMFCSLRYCMSS